MTNIAIVEIFVFQTLEKSIQNFAKKFPTDATYGFAHAKVKKLFFEPKIPEFIGNISDILNDFVSRFFRY